MRRTLTTEQLNALFQTGEAVLRGDRIVAPLLGAKVELGGRTWTVTAAGGGRVSLEE